MFGLMSLDNCVHPCNQQLEQLIKCFLPKKFTPTPFQ